MTFDDVLPQVVRCCEEHDPDAKKLERIYVVRDAHGRVRLCVKPCDGAAPDLPALETQLSNSLGVFFDPPLLDPGSKGGTAGLARGLISKAEALGFKAWQPDPPDPGPPLAAGRWFLLERRLSKVEWLDGCIPELPWQSGDGPPIIAFYSFKGGVGRTTAMLSCAWQLAAQGNQVAIVDLDLEAPGLGALCCEPPRVEGRGVLDYLVDQIATGSAEHEDLGIPASALGEEAERVTVYPAGSLQGGYLEKLARLDFMNSGGAGEISPAAKALRQLLLKIRNPADGIPKPQYILLDSRAGLHDIAGLSLHGLAHLDVLFGRASEQSYQGMDLTVRTLARRKGAALSCVMVHGLAPVTASDPIKKPESEEGRFLERVFKIFESRIYKLLEERGETVPSEATTDGPHSPVALHTNEKLERFLKVDKTVRYELFGPDYVELVRAIQAKLPKGASAESQR